MPILAVQGIFYRDNLGLGLGDNMDSSPINCPAKIFNEPAIYNPKLNTCSYEYDFSKNETCTISKCSNNKCFYLKCKNVDKINPIPPDPNPKPTPINNTCNKLTCINGVCSSDDICICNINFSGIKCDKSVYCDPECLNGGECINGLCKCKNGYDGLDCSTINIIPLNCLNGGYYDSINRICVCNTKTTGFSGNLCEIDCNKNKLQINPETSFQMILSGNNDISYDADVYIIDLFTSTADTIKQLHNKGRIVICYFSAGSIESDRPDTSLFPSSIKSNKMDGWPEYWIDISQLLTEPKLKQIMINRMDLAVQKGCDGIDPDNMDSYSNNVKKVIGNGYITSQDQLNYNKWIATTAHSKNLLVDLKNDLDQIKDLVDYFDFAVNEQCFQYQECSMVIPFINSNKAVFNIEYEIKPEKYCETATAQKIDSLYKTLDLTFDPFIQCRSYTSNPSINQSCSVIKKLGNDNLSILCNTDPNINNGEFDIANPLHVIIGISCFINVCFLLIFIFLAIKCIKTDYVDYNTNSNKSINKKVNNVMI